MKPCALFDSPCWCDKVGYFSGDCKKARAKWDQIMANAKSKHERIADSTDTVERPN